MEVNLWERIEAGSIPIPQLSERIEYPAELLQTLECSWLSAETVGVKDVALVFLPGAIENTQVGVCVGMKNAFIGRFCLRRREGVDDKLLRLGEDVESAPSLFLEGIIHSRIITCTSVLLLYSNFALSIAYAYFI